MRRIAMLMTWDAGFTHFWPGTEGDCLQKLGLLDVRERSNDYEVLPTEKLRALFYGSVDLEHVFPLLVEVVIYHTYRNEPGLVDRWRLGLKLQALGMTPEGLEWLHERFLDRRPA